MEFKEIDIENSSKEDIEIEIDRLKKAKAYYSNIEKALKSILVSSYGVFGSEYFVFNNYDIAESIALQGQDLIKYSQHAINYYFNNLWHTDKKLHNRLKIENVKKINEDLIVAGVVDSLFVTFEPVLNSISSEIKNPLNLILKIYNYRLRSFISNSLKKYSKKFNIKNSYDFQLKSISDYGMFFSKNHYVLSILWANDIKYESLQKLKIAGIEIINKSYPKFVRDKLQEFIKFLLKENNEINLNDIIIKLKNLKKEFKLQNINEISMSMSVNEYEKYVQHKKNEIIFNSNIPIHVQGAAFYNDYLLKNKNFLKKYSLINKGARVKYYYTNENSIFSYLPNSYPIEFAPEIDYEKMFNKLLLEPINRFIKVLDKPEIPQNLITFKKLF